MRGKRGLIVTVALLFATINVFATRHIRWGSSGDPLNGLTVTWTSDGGADSVKWGYTSNYEKGVYSGAKRSGYSGNFFKYVFPTVNANTTIYYKVYDSSTQTWESGKTYKTAPPSNTSEFSFCALGDSRNGLSVWNKISGMAKDQNAAFTLYNGDIVDNGGSTSEWDNWFNNGADYLETNMVYHALGNHDAQSVPTYKNIFELPKANGTNLYYSFKYGNALFIVLNSESPGDYAQAGWLVSTLSAAAQDPTIVWKIVSFHRPFYTVGNHAGEMDGYFNTWWKAFDDYGVDLILNGHDHMYERTKPINRNVSKTSAVTKYGSAPGEGRCQIVCGGAGAPLYSGSPTWSIEKFQSKYNFCKFTINGSVLCDTTYDNNGNVIDAFCIDKSGITTGTGNVAPQIFNEIKLYPNPTQTSFTVDYSSALHGKAEVRIFDMAGREVFYKKLDKENDRMKLNCDLTGFAAGTYNVQVMIDEQKDNALLIVQ